MHFNGQKKKKERRKKKREIEDIAKMTDLVVCSRSRRVDGVARVTKTRMDISIKRRLNVDDDLGEGGRGNRVSGNRVSGTELPVHNLEKKRKKKKHRKDNNL